MIDTVRWTAQGKEPLPGKLRMIDQTLLPEKFTFIETDKLDEIFDSIKRLVVRGAPAIGIAAAFGLTAAVQNSDAANPQEFINEAQKAADYLESSRPTAVNLSWALNRCMQKIAFSAEKGANVKSLKNILYEEAEQILSEDISMCRQIGEHGVSLFSQNTSVMTHCNAGALATGDFGTALSPIYQAQEKGLQPKVFSNETRPLLQGSRLTAWELQRAGVDVTTICDNMAGQVMKEGKIDLVITGADRVAANGDAANKIGTYSVAVLAQYHKIPLYIAVPYSTIDMSLSDGTQIPIEQRDSDEICNGFGRRTAPKNIAVYNPAFDVTPCELIKGIITERGILKPPFKESISRLFQA